MKRETRFDTKPLSGGLAEFVTPQAAEEYLNRQEGAEAARLRMLARLGLNTEDSPADEARQRMIQRREKR